MDFFLISDTMFGLNPFISRERASTRCYVYMLHGDWSHDQLRNRPPSEVFHFNTHRLYDKAARERESRTGRTEHNFLKVIFDCFT